MVNARASFSMLIDVRNCYSYGKTLIYHIRLTFIKKQHLIQDQDACFTHGSV